MDNGSLGRVPCIVGTGLQAWEIIWIYLSFERSFEQLSRWYDLLSTQQLEAALAYYAAFPDEVDADIAENDRMLAELERTSSQSAGAHHLK